MARSLGNFITLDQLFSGNHPMLEQPYSPMTHKILHSSALITAAQSIFSNEALQAAEKGLQRLSRVLKHLTRLNLQTSRLLISAISEKML